MIGREMKLRVEEIDGQPGADRAVYRPAEREIRRDEPRHERR